MINTQQEIDQEVLSKRRALGNVYRTEEGLYELARTIRECGVFDQIPCTEGAVELHNFGVRKLEDLGMLDEESFVELLKWMLSHEWKIPIDNR